MSTLNVSNITDGTDTVETGYVVNGSAKAWVNFDGESTAAIRDSFNSSSLSDNGVGNYTVTFTNSMSNSSYSAPAAGSSIYGISNHGCGMTNARTVSTLDFLSTDDTSTTRDARYFDAAIHGDLA